MKKILLIIVPIILILLIGGGCFYWNQVKEKESKKLDYQLQKKVEVNLEEEYYNTSALTIKKNGTLETKKEKVDTSKVGKQEIKLSIKDAYGKTKEVSYILEVVDKEPPKITFTEKLTVEEKNTIDLLKGVTVIDNSKEDIKVNVEGEYDTNTPGTYELFYTAKDSSGNEAKEKFTLEVTKKVVVTPPAPTYTPAPASPTVSDKEFTTSNGHKGIVKDGITYIDGYLIANKTYTLPSSYNPGMQSIFTNNFNQMKSAAASQGINIYIISGFRSYNTQQNTYAGWVAKYGQATADTISARPGHSEHQSGLAADINSLDQSFEYTAEGKWLNDNCYKYGFIIRYIKGKEHETGYAFEPWHIRYVGTDLATKLYNNGNWITMENYFGITSKYS